MVFGRAEGLSVSIALSSCDGVCAASVPVLPQPTQLDRAILTTTDAASVSGLALAKRQVARSAIHLSAKMVDPRGSVATSCAGTICARGMGGAMITGVQSVVVVR